VGHYCRQDPGLPESGDLSGPYAGPLSLAVVVIPVTYLTLIIGELVPKKLAVSYPEKMSVLTAPLMYMLMRLTMPGVHLLSGSTGAVVRNPHSRYPVCPKGSVSGTGFSLIRTYFKHKERTCKK
jgi:putative hemolysin